MRRQKCDLKDPCTRCVQSNEESSCSRKWPDGYDPRIHRTYPKSKAVQAPTSSTPLESNNNGVVPQNGARDASFTQSAITTSTSFSSQPPYQEISNLASSHRLVGTVYPNDVRQTAPNGFPLAQSGINPTSPGFPTNQIAKPSNFGPSNVQSLIDPYVDTGNNGNNPNPNQIGVDFSPRAIEIHHLQTLIPTSRQILQLVEYHEANLLWYHCCVHGPTFRMELIKAMQASDGLQVKSLNLQWCALLFSVMAASLTCASDSVAHSLGFPKAQKRFLSKQWYKATVSCLDLGDYTSKLHVYSIQAIQVLSMSAHTIGTPNRQFTIFGAALRIAQNLGLQRLAQDPEFDNFTVDNVGISQSLKDLLIKRETERRIWTQMCSQDWFSIPSSEMYSINKQHFTTIKPHRIDDEKMILAEDHVPLGTDLCNYLYDVASLMADFHDSVTALVDPVAKYEQVLKYDSRLRALDMAPAHHTLLTETTEVFRSPWVGWARGVAHMVHAHKIIMIHRSFLGKSFTDSSFAYTRWASIAASKAILREVGIASADVERPTLWTDQV